MCYSTGHFRKENQVQGEEMFVRKDGSFYHVGFTASPIRDSSSGVAVGTVIEAVIFRQKSKHEPHSENFNVAPAAARAWMKS